jgi:hypothetical protein
MIPPIGTDHVFVYNDESRSEHVLDHLLSITEHLLYCILHKLGLHAFTQQQPIQRPILG